MTVLGRLARSKLLRAAITVALLVVVFRSLDLETALDRVREGNPLDGLLAVACVVLALSVGAWRWDRLLRVADIPLPAREVARIYAVTSFANAFLPTSVGGDVARPLMVARSGPRLTRAITTVVLERLAALVALVALALVGWALEPSDVSPTAATFIGACTAGLVGGTAALLLWPQLFGRLARFALPEQLTAHIADAGAVVHALRARPMVTVTVGIQSVAFQALVTMQLVLIARMIGAPLSFGLAAVALALVTLATLIPISIGGFGVREGSYAVILAGGGISHTDAVLISLLTVVVLLVATLPGAIALIREGFRVAEEPSTP